MGERELVPLLCSRSASFDGSLARAQEEIVILRREVDDLNSQLTSSTISHSLLQVDIPYPPLSLSPDISLASQSLLQDSCRYEREHVEKRRGEAQDEITRAQKVVSHVICHVIPAERLRRVISMHMGSVVLLVISVSVVACAFSGVL